MRGYWMWMPSTLLAQAQGFSGGCTCGFTEDEGFSVNMFVLLFLMCVMLVGVYKAFQHFATLFSKKGVTEETPRFREKTGPPVACHVCKIPSYNLPFDQCRTCGASPSYHHGRCCPVRTGGTVTTTEVEVNPDCIYVCGSPCGHAYHLSQECPALKKTRTKQKVVRCDLCKTCESMSAKKAD